MSRDGWSGADGGYGLPLASETTEAQRRAASLALACAAVHAGDDRDGLKQALEILLGLRFDQTEDPEC